MNDPAGGGDPILLELLRARLEAAAEEGALAIEQTAVSPIVADGKDFSTNIFTADGRVLAGGGKVDYKWAAATNAVQAVIARHGADVAPGDVFAANDPHHGGGNHPQDVEICQPVFVGSDVVGWIGSSAHLIDVGGMAFGSWAPDATDCYQEALRFPPVRLFAGGREATDLWAVILNNVRLPGLVEMDMRGLVAGCAVTGSKLVDIATTMGVDRYAATAQALCDHTERELRRRIAAIEPGRYSATGWVEWGDERLELPCRLDVGDGGLRFDFTGAPAQVPHFINSKAYIVRGEIVADVRSLLAQDLPFCDGIFPPVEVVCPPGTVVDAREPAPVGSAHLDVAMNAAILAVQCLQLALAATAGADQPLFCGPSGVAAMATHSWSYTDPAGCIDGLVVNESWQSGSSAGWDRDGSDLFPLLTGSQNVFDFVDVEILEAWYPVEVVEKRCAPGPDGAGRFRAGAGCQLAYRVKAPAGATGTMLAMRDGLPVPGVAGGDPGAPTDFRVHHADGTVQVLPAHAEGVHMDADDVFVMRAGSGGGWGDPLDRPVDDVVRDVRLGRLDATEALASYGVVVSDLGTADDDASAAERAARRDHRLRMARPPAVPVDEAPLDEAVLDEAVLAGSRPLFHGVVQVGDRAVVRATGAVLAVSPAHWTDGCPVLEEPRRSAAGVAWTKRSYLDPVSGRALHTEAVPPGAQRAFTTMPNRWCSPGGPGTSTSSPCT